MTKLLHGNEKNSLTGGREPLFSQKELLVLAVPLLVEQLLEVTVGMADTMMVSRCGEAAISGVSLVAQRPVRCGDRRGMLCAGPPYDPAVLRLY